MAVNQKGIYYWQATDEFAPTRQIKGLVDSIDIIVGVSSDVERDQLDKFEGLKVKRLDKGGVIETFIDGGWVGPGDTILSLSNGWSPVAGGLDLRLSVREGIANLNGYVQRTSGSNLVLATVPDAFKPAQDHVWATPSENIGPAAAGPMFRFYLQKSDGQINVNLLPITGTTWSTTTRIPISTTWQIRYL